MSRSVRLVSGRTRIQSPRSQARLGAQLPPPLGFGPCPGVSASHPHLHHPSDLSLPHCLEAQLDLTDGLAAARCPLVWGCSRFLGMLGPVRLDALICSRPSRSPLQARSPNCPSTLIPLITPAVPGLLHQHHLGNRLSSASFQG